MTQQDKYEQFSHNLNMAVLNAHKHGMSWKKLHELLSTKSSEVWAQHQAMLKLFPENATRRTNK